MADVDVSVSAIESSDSISIGASVEEDQSSIVSQEGASVVIVEVQATDSGSLSVSEG